MRREQGTREPQNFYRSDCLVIEELPQCLVRQQGERNDKMRSWKAEGYPLRFMAL